MILTRPPLNALIGPSTLPVALLDFEADTLSLADNDPVSTWTDSSPNGNNATASGAARPTYKATSGPGSRPCVSFDGGDALDLNSTTSVVTDITIFAVLKLGDSGTRTIVSGASGSCQYRTNSLKQDLLKASILDLGGSTTSLSTSAFQQINVVMTGGGSGPQFRLSGAADGTGGFNAIFTAGFTTLGAKNGPAELFLGDICMVKVFGVALTLAQIQAQEAAITSRWGV